MVSNPTAFVSRDGKNNLTNHCPNGRTYLYVRQAVPAHNERKKCVCECFNSKIVKIARIACVCCTTSQSREIWRKSRAIFANDSNDRNSRELPHFCPYRAMGGGISREIQEFFSCTKYGKFHCSVGPYLTNAVYPVLDTAYSTGKA